MDIKYSNLIPFYFVLLVGFNPVHFLFYVFIDDKIRNRSCWSSNGL